MKNGMIMANQLDQMSTVNERARQETGVIDGLPQNHVKSFCKGVYFNANALSKVHSMSNIYNIPLTWYGAKGISFLSSVLLARLNTHYPTESLIFRS